MSNERLIIIFWAVPCLGFLIYLFFQNFFGKETNIQSEKYNNLIDLFGIFLFVINSAIPFLIKIEKYSDAIIISAIINGMIAYIHNLFKMKANNDKKFQEVNENLKILEAALEKTNGDYRDILCNPAYAFKANKKFSEKLKNESYRVTSYYYDKQDTLEDRLLGNFPDSGTTVDQETAELLLSIASEKAISALDQFGGGKIFLRRELFKPFWESAVQSSSSYLSICDLSMYSGKDGSQINSEKLNWKKRVEGEIAVLKCGEIRKFDKIILFESNQDDQSGSNNAIFKEVINLWKISVQELKDLGIKSHCRSKNGNCMIWKFSREDFSSWLNDINRSNEVSGQINSNDLGIFGDYLIGEEFKVNEVLTTTGGLENNNDVDELKFLYRFSIQKDLVKEIREMTIRKIESLA